MQVKGIAGKEKCRQCQTHINREKYNLEKIEREEKKQKDRQRERDKQRERERERQIERERVINIKYQPTK